MPRKVYAGWVQDDWNIRKRLTLNLGVRYDLETGVFAEHIEFLPFLKANRPSDTNNIGPRAGFALQPRRSHRHPRRGREAISARSPGQPAFWTVRYTEQIHPEILYDGRPDFAINPFNGPAPTYAQALATTCAVSPGPTCVRVARSPRSWPRRTCRLRTAIRGHSGMQRQLGTTTAVEADYAHDAIEGGAVYAAESST